MENKEGTHYMIYLFWFIVIILVGSFFYSITSMKTKIGRLNENLEENDLKFELIDMYLKDIRLRLLNLPNTTKKVETFNNNSCWLELQENYPNYYSYSHKGDRRQCPPDVKFYNERYNLTLSVSIRSSEVLD